MQAIYIQTSFHFGTGSSAPSGVALGSRKSGCCSSFRYLGGVRMLVPPKREQKHRISKRTEFKTAPTAAFILWEWKHRECDYCHFTQVKFCWICYKGNINIRFQNRPQQDPIIWEYVCSFYPSTYTSILYYHVMLDQTCYCQSYTSNMKNKS